MREPWQGYLIENGYTEMWLLAGFAGLLVMVAPEWKAIQGWLAGIKLPVWPKSKTQNEPEWWLAQKQYVDNLAVKLSEHGYTEQATMLTGPIKVAMSRVAFGLEENDE